MIERFGARAQRISDGAYCWLAAWLSLLLTLPTVLLGREPATDTMMYYSPMIRQLGMGDWAHAFWPQVPPLFVLSAGPFAWLGMDGYMAAKLTASLYLAASVWPLYRLLRELFAERHIAQLGVLLLVFFSRLTRYAGDGIRTPPEVFFMLLMVYGTVIFWRRREWRGMLWVTLGGAGLSLTWGGGVALAGVALLFCLLVELRGPRDEVWCGRLPLRSLAGMLICGVLLMPWVAYVYRQSGYPVTDMRHVRVIAPVAGMFQALGLVRPGDLADDPAEAVRQAAARERVHGPPRPRPAWWQHVWTDVIVEIIKGLEPAYLLFALPVIWWRLRQGRWRPAETILVASIVVYLLLLSASLGWVTKRYVVIVTPLTFGWAAIGMLRFAGWVQARHERRGALALKALVILAVLVSIWDSTANLRPSIRQDDRDEWASMYACAQWLRVSGKQHVPPDHQPLTSSNLLYHNGLLPIVLTGGKPNVAYFGEADVFIPYGNSFSMARLLDYCRVKRVNYIYCEPTLVSKCKELANLEALPPELVLLKDARGVSGEGGVLLGFRPHLTGLEK